LLTLSACNTGINGGGSEPNGNEVENFGVIAQKRGAKAVIATLWAVGDNSTRALMSEFYRIRSKTPNITKAEALRRAQVDLLNAVPASSGADAPVPPANPVGSDIPKSGSLPFHHSTERPYAHPYYWAPFILIGNWH
jgi:CHAT domain-containing protein